MYLKESRDSQDDRSGTEGTACPRPWGPEANFEGPRTGYNEEGKLRILGASPHSGHLRVTLFNGQGDNGSSLVGTLAGRGTTLMSSVTNAAASPMCRPVRVRNVNPYMFVSATKFSSRNRLNSLHVRQALRTTSGTSVTLVIYYSARLSRRRQ